uniref:Pentatricopeptide repeat-containing protein n=1 Tax=Chenopodium quinoa TaxID=63459 RepID=A0A803LN30_CHEQI
MAVTTLCSRSRAASTFFFRFFHGASSRHSLSISSDTPPASSDDVNDISRVLSDFRGPQHDIESALTPFSSKLSTNLVEQVLKRTKNLGFSAHRFFLWAKKLPGFQPDVNSYRILIDVLGSSKQFPLIWDLLSEVKSGENFELCSEIFWVIFGAYCRANLPNDAIRAFNRMSEFGLEPSLNDLDHLLYLLCRKKFVKEGQEFFDKIKVDVPAYNSLLEALCNGGDLDEAYAMFRAMESKGLAPDACTYSIFIRSYCKRDNIHSVFRVLDRMKRYELVPNLYTYNCIIKKLCLIEKVEDAHQLLDEMIEGGVSPDTWSYNAIMAFHCDRNEVNRAVRLLSRMEKENCKPDRHSWNMLLKMLIRVGRFDKVEEVWGSMPRKGFYPSVSTYAVMTHGFLKKKGKLDEAIKYFDMMIDEGIPPYSSTIEQLRNRFVGWGMMEKVEILADKMEASSSSSIKELSKTMRGHRSQRSRQRREDESSESSEEEWPFMPDAS